MYKNCLTVRYSLTFNRSYTQTATHNVDKEWKNAKPFEEIPKPGLSYPLNFFPGGKLHKASFAQMHRHLRDNYGNIVALKGILGGNRMVTIYEPDDFAKVFRADGVWSNRTVFDSLKYYRQKLRPDVYKSAGLMLEQDEAWHKFRSIVNPVMMQPRNVSLYVPKIDELTKNFIEITKKSRDVNNETPADFGQYIQRWALESIGIIGLDTKFGLLEPNVSPDANKFAKLLDEFFSLMFQLEILPNFWRYFTTSKLRQFVKINDEITNIALEHIEKVIQRINSEAVSKPIEEQSILEKLLKLDKTVATVMSLDMLVVGVDTTSSSVNGLLYLLAKNPEKQQKLRNEILSILPNKNTSLTPDKLKHLPYLRACLKEAHRTMPVAGAVIRKTSKDLVLQGYRIPKNEIIIMATQLCTENEKYYPRAKEFIPERWLKNGSNDTENCPHVQNMHPFTFLPFGFGGRSCVGKRLAELEASIFIIRFLREFNVEWFYPDLRIKSTFVDQLVGDMKFKLTDLPH